MQNEDVVLKKELNADHHKNASRDYSDSGTIGALHIMDNQFEVREEYKTQKFTCYTYLASSPKLNG